MVTGRHIFTREDLYGTYRQSNRDNVLRRRRGDLHGYSRYVCRACVLVSESRQILAEALFDNRMEDYIRRVHAVKSNSRSVGALAVGDLAEKIERAARESRKADVMEDHQELIRMLSQVEAEAQQILNSNS